MAKSTGDGGGTEATTLIFPKKSDWDALAEAKRTASKRAKSANGTYGKELTRLVEQCNMDRRAARIVLQLDAIEDEEDLHVTVFHLIDGMKKLNILKRAMATEDFFDDRKIDTAALATAGTKASRKKKGATGADIETAEAAAGRGATVHPIGDAARRVAEAAGADK